MISSLIIMTKHLNNTDKCSQNYELISRNKKYGLVCENEKWPNFDEVSKNKVKPSQKNFSNCFEILRQHFEIIVFEFLFILKKFLITLEIYSIL